MSRFSVNANNKQFFMIRRKSANVLNVPEPVLEQPIVELIVEPTIESTIVEEPPAIQLVIEEPPAIQSVIEEPTIQEPEIKLEEIYQNNETSNDVITPVENPQQIQLQKRKSKEKFKLLVEQIMLNKKKEIVDGWTV